MRRALAIALLLSSAACGDDITRVQDAAIDAGPDDAGRDARVSCPAVACRSDQFCDVSACGGSGECAPTPTSCPLSFHPVCGCNHVTYQNDCIREVAGVGLLNVGRCNEICSLTPRSNECCYSDGDCRNQLCAGQLCDVGKEGRCVTAPVNGRCWYDADCADAGVCQGAVLCPCGASCLQPDAPGTCGSP